MHLTLERLEAKAGVRVLGDILLETGTGMDEELWEGSLGSCNDWTVNKKEINNLNDVNFLIE